MAKVALITYHRAHNNGSFLQAFATQQAIENLGHQCDVIDFSTPKQQYVYDVYKKIRTPKDVLKNCYAFLNRKIIQKRHDDFDTNVIALRVCFSYSFKWIVFFFYGRSEFDECEVVANQ